MRELTLSALIAKYDHLHLAIESNDGRLTTASSAQLDCDQEELCDVASELRRRLGFENAVRVAVERGIEEHNRKRSRMWPLSWLIRLGIVSVCHNGELHWPISISSRHMWRFLIRHEPWFGVFRNSPGVIKWVQNRWLPWRWGVRFLGLEIGDRGSSYLREDPRRKSLWK